MAHKSISNIVTCHVLRYNSIMIMTFADKATQELFETGKSQSFPREIQPRALRKMDMIDAAYRIEDLAMPPGNRLHALQGNRVGQYAIAVNAQWRICFSFSNEDAFDVELCNYH